MKAYWFVVLMGYFVGVFICIPLFPLDHVILTAVIMLAGIFCLGKAFEENEREQRQQERRK